MTSNVTMALNRMKEMFDEKGCVKIKADALPMTMSHAAYIVDCGLKTQNPMYAAYCAGFGIRAMIGFGVFDLKKLEEILKLLEMK